MLIFILKGRREQALRCPGNLPKGVVPKPANQVGTIKIDNHAQLRIHSFFKRDRLGVPIFPSLQVCPGYTGNDLLSDDDLLLLLMPGASGQAVSTFERAITPPG